MHDGKFANLPVVDASTGKPVGVVDVCYILGSEDIGVGRRGLETKHVEDSGRVEVHEQALLAEPFSRRTCDSRRYNAERYVRERYASCDSFRWDSDHIRTIKGGPHRARKHS